MAIDILPANHNDAPKLVPIGIRAFEHDELHGRLESLEGLSSAELDEHMQWRIARNVRRMAGPHDFWYQAIDTETGEPVGYTGVLAPEKGKTKGTLAGDAAELAMPACINKEVHDLLGETFDRVRKQHMGDRDDYWCKFVSFYLQILHSDSFRRLVFDGCRPEMSRSGHRKAAVGEGLRACRPGRPGHISRIHPCWEETVPGGWV